jgi:hypothetical protein
MRWECERASICGLCHVHTRYVRAYTSPTVDQYRASVVGSHSISESRLRWTAVSDISSYPDLTRATLERARKPSPNISNGSPVVIWGIMYCGVDMHKSSDLAFTLLPTSLQGFSSRHRTLLVIHSSKADLAGFRFDHVLIRVQVGHTPRLAALGWSLLVSWLFCRTRMFQATPPSLSSPETHLHRCLPSRHH